VPIKLVITPRFISAYPEGLNLALTFLRLDRARLQTPKIDYICEQTYAEHRASGQTPLDDASDDKTLETVAFEVPALWRPAVKPRSSWDQTKRDQYDAIVAAVRGKYLGYCDPNARFIVTVPDFEPGDAYIYVMVRWPASYSETDVEWVFLGRDDQTGRYTALDGKTMSLPDEIKNFVPLIRSQAVSRFEIQCPAK
jgi:hypothetical protein